MLNLRSVSYFLMTFLGISSCKPLSTGSEVANINRYGKSNAPRKQICGEQKYIPLLQKDLDLTKSLNRAEAEKRAFSSNLYMLPRPLKQMLGVSVSLDKPKTNSDEKKFPTDYPKGGSNITLMGTDGKNKCLEEAESRLRYDKDKDKDQEAFDSCWISEENKKPMLFVSAFPKNIHAHLISRATYMFFETGYLAFGKTPTPTTDEQRKMKEEFDKIAIMAAKYYEFFEKSSDPAIQKVFTLIKEDVKNLKAKDPNQTALMQKQVASTFLVAEAVDSLYCSQEQTQIFENTYRGAMVELLNLGVLNLFGPVNWLNGEKIQEDYFKKVKEVGMPSSSKASPK